MAFYAYILFSKSCNQFYYGSTSNLQDRLRRHNSNHKGFTGKANDWEIVYFEEFKSKSDALKRENYFKKIRNKNFIRDLIRSKKDISIHK